MPISGYQDVLLFYSIRALYILGELVNSQFPDKLLDQNCAL